MSDTKFCLHSQGKLNLLNKIQHLAGYVWLLFDSIVDLLLVLTRVFALAVFTYIFSGIFQLAVPFHYFFLFFIQIKRLVYIQRVEPFIQREFKRPKTKASRQVAKGEINRRARHKRALGQVWVLAIVQHLNQCLTLNWK